MADDLTAIATIGVAIATSVLALATFFLARAASKTLEEEKQQLRMLTYQARAVRSQMDPLLKLHSWSFKRNKLSVEVENLGPGRAFWLVVRSWFHPTSMITRAEENGAPLSDEEIKSLIAKGVKKVWVNPTGLLQGNKRLEFQGKEVETTDTANTLYNDKLGGESILDPVNRLVMEVEPRFAIKPAKKRFVSGGWAFNPLDFDHAKDFLRSNRATFAVLGFDIACKNSVGDTVHGQSFGHLVVHLYDDATLEDVQKRDFEHGLFTLGERDMTFYLKHADWTLYDQGKIIKPPEEEPWKKHQ